jgi:transcriptional regulator with XRE-family HTH domain
MGPQFLTSPAREPGSIASLTLGLAGFAAGPSVKTEDLKMAHNASPISDLEFRRRSLGWSLKELGDRCGIDGAFLSDWERGFGSPRLAELQHWTAALGLALELVPVGSECRNRVLVDWDKCSVKVGGTPIRLTPMEWKTLERLAWTPGELVTHQMLFRHLYGDDPNHRAQSTAVRVLINKLRRLIPIRIEAKWGQGYVIRGLPSSLSLAPEDNRIGGKSVTPRPAVAETLCDRAALATWTAPRDPPAIRREHVDHSEPGIRRIAAPIHLDPRRAEELGAIEKFLNQRGVTRCPDVAAIQRSPLPTLIWDKVKRKWVRPSLTAQEAR